MGTPLIPDPDLRRIVAAAKRQGCTLKPTRSGLQLLTPGGSIVTIHRSKTSSRRRLITIITDLKRGGVTV